MTGRGIPLDQRSLRQGEQDPLQRYKGNRNSYEFLIVKNSFKLYEPTIGKNLACKPRASSSPKLLVSQQLSSHLHDT